MKKINGNIIDNIYIIKQITIILNKKTCKRMKKLIKHKNISKTKKKLMFHKRNKRIE